MAVTKIVKVVPSRKLKGFTIALYGRVYTNLSALVYMDQHGRPVSFQQFDTYAGFPTVIAPIPDGCSVVLVSNHPEGGTGLSDEDERNLHAAFHHFQRQMDIYLLVGPEFMYAGSCLFDTKTDSDEKPHQAMPSSYNLLQ